MAAVAIALYPNQLTQQRQWLQDSCHHLKHEPGAATQLYEQMQDLSLGSKHSHTIESNLAAAVTYFHNHQHQINYALYRGRHDPIGSGVTEAACKTVIKQRLCCSGMRCQQKAAAILSLRALVLTSTRWNQFWNKLNQSGFPVAG